MYLKTYLECFTYSYVEIQKHEKSNKCMAYITICDTKIYVYSRKSVYA